MIGNTVRRRLLQSSLQYRQHCRKRTLRSSLVGSTAVPTPFVGFFHATPTRDFVSSNAIHTNDNKPLRFEDLNLHPRTLKALQRHGLHKPTEVQRKTFEAIRTGHNVVARSRTGTGKTLAFLVPSLERSLESTTRGVPILILAPTRELASQIGKEAERLTQKHPNVSAQVLTGGSSKQEDITKFQNRLPTILVATPGRLKDHLATTTLRLACNPIDEDEIDSSKPHEIRFRSILQNGNLQTLVLDETDRLLELGFRRDVQEIVSCLNDDTSSRQSRQTLLFSATLSPSIMDVVDLTIGSKDYRMIDCVEEDDVTTHTNATTSQSYVTLPPERFWTGSLEFILQLFTQPKKKKPKIIVFFELTRLAQLYTKFLSLRMGHTQGVWELHGKMHQRERTLTTRRFRNAPSGLLLTSDVSARGVDYPGVTHVIQIGAPQNRETYIHRLGRTGRAGKEGSGVLLLPEHEQDFVDTELEGLGVQPDVSLQNRLRAKRATGSLRREITNELGMLRYDLQSGSDHTGMEQSLKLAYHSLVSYYFQTRRGSASLQSTVTIVNQLIRDFGLPELPVIGHPRAKSLGIDHLSGHLNIRKDWEDQTIGTSNETNDSDDWFGVSPSTDSKFKTKKPKRKPKRFDDRQRYDSAGEFPN